MKPTYKQVTKTRYIEQISQLAEEIFVQHYTKLTPKVARALAEKYQSDILTDDEIHSGTVNYFMIYLGSDPVGYFALDLTPTGAMCLSRLFLLEKARGQGIGRSIVAAMLFPKNLLRPKAPPKPWPNKPGIPPAARTLPPSSRPLLHCKLSAKTCATKTRPPCTGWIPTAMP